MPQAAQRVTPQLLSIYFRYVRNLSLIDRRLTPDLYTLVVAAQQTAGDDFALALAETAREYPYLDRRRRGPPMTTRARPADGRSTGPTCPAGASAPMVNRLPGQAIALAVVRAATAAAGARPAGAWRQRWNPFGHVLLAAGGRPHRELPAPRPRPGQGGPRAPTWPDRRSSPPA